MCVILLLSVILLYSLPILEAARLGGSQNGQ
jgi:hypothetical protein